MAVESWGSALLWQGWWRTAGPRGLKWGPRPREEWGSPGGGRVLQASMGGKHFVWPPWRFQMETTHCWAECMVWILDPSRDADKNAVGDFHFKCYICMIHKGVLLNCYKFCIQTSSNIKTHTSGLWLVRKDLFLLNAQVLRGRGKLPCSESAQTAYDRRQAH